MQNNSFSGLVDSNSCFNIADTASGCCGKIYFDEVNPNEAVFIRYKFNGGTIPLDTSGVYKLTLDAYPSNFNSIDTSGNCPDNLCTGVHIGIQIPDSMGTGTAMRWYAAKYAYDPFAGFQIVGCFPTEKFINGNNISSLIIKFTPGSVSPGDFFSFSHVKLESSVFVERIYHIDASFTIGPQHYQKSLSYFADNLLMYNDSTYPSPTHNSYVDAQPLPNTSTRDTIDVMVGSFSFLTMQPYTQLRGGFVNGSTVLRHIVNLIVYGTVCIPFIDVIFQGGNSFIYRSGKVDMAGPNSCMLFTGGSKLVVDDHATLEYGKGQQGFLALLPGGTIDIRQDAELKIFNTVMLAGGSGQQIFMELNRSSKLTFMPGSHLKNTYSVAHTMHLNVYMKGGTLDDSGLPEAERNLINRIYDTASDQLEDNIHLFNNPIGSSLNFSFVFDHPSTFNAMVFSAEGKPVNEHTFIAQKGINYYNLDLVQLPNGVYFLKLETDQGVVARKFIKIITGSH